MIISADRIQNLLSGRKGFFMVLFVWLLAELVWYMVFGVLYQLESRKYINEANYLLKHHSLSQQRFLFYLPTILVIAFSFTVKAGLTGALIILLLYNLFAYYRFFLALKKYFT